MKIKPILFLILFFSVLSIGTFVSASGKCSEVRASVRATATVVHPLGITTNSTFNNEQSNYWIVRYPKLDGIQMTFSQNGKLIRSVDVDQLDTEINHGTYTIIKSIDNLIKSTGRQEISVGQIVITLLSTTQ